MKMYIWLLGLMQALCVVAQSEAWDENEFIS